MAVEMATGLFTRRNVLKTVVAGVLVSAGNLLTRSGRAGTAEVIEGTPKTVFPERALWLHRVQTREEGRVLYYQDNTVVQEGYALLCYLLRDVRAEQATPMDLGLIHLLFGIQTWMRACGIRQPLQVNSGYRTPQTNAHTEGAAVHSRHLLGQAADFTVAGIPPPVLAKLALKFNTGGVGVYPGFVHVDTGPIRMWTS